MSSVSFTADKIERGIVYASDRLRILVGPFEWRWLADFRVLHEKVVLVDIDLHTRVSTVELE